jgi:Mor family transcriptional regulator
MRYINAKDVLPETLLVQIQQYVKGKAIYIPQFENEKEAWGNNTRTKSDIFERNYEIKQRKASGATIYELMLEYNLAYDTIKSIIYRQS